MFSSLKPLKIWLSAFRLHTLPLSFSGLLMGNFIAFAHYKIDPLILIFGIITGISLQILSNLANDYGDFIHGNDSEKRTGPQRAVQSGAISATGMKRAFIIFIIISLVSGILLLIASEKNTGIFPALIMMAIGILSVWSAYNYTASKKPYGYKGWGDLFVFIFFGIVAVAGSFYLQTGKIEAVVFLPAAAIGLFSTAVLNLNNIRDISNDSESGKITVAVRLGMTGAKIYHCMLLFTGCSLQLIYCFFNYFSFFQYYFLLPLVFIIMNGIIVFVEKDNLKYYLHLKRLSLSVLIYVVSFSISLVV